MPDGELHGNPHDMRTVAGHIQPPPVQQTLTRNARSGACGSGMVECGAFVAADASSTHALQRFVTQTVQGFKTYQNIVTECASRIEQARAESEQELFAVTHQSPSNLPEFAPVFQHPNP